MSTPLIYVPERGQGNFIPTGLWFVIPEEIQGAAALLVQRVSEDPDQSDYTVLLCEDILQGEQGYGHALKINVGGRVCTLYRNDGKYRTGVAGMCPDKEALLDYLRELIGE